jgi:hypothetical protein
MSVDAWRSIRGPIFILAFTGTSALYIGPRIDLQASTLILRLVAHVQYPRGPVKAWLASPAAMGDVQSIEAATRDSD